MRRNFLFAAILSAGLLCLSWIVSGTLPVTAAMAGESPVFISVLDDLPLMKGLVEAPDSATVFDTARGRIVEAVAEGALQKDRVLAFYEQTLPQLGWKTEAPGVFRREGEVLRLEFSSQSTPSPGGTPATRSVLTVVFRLMPSGG
ncbi:MAG: hypothetical protein ISR51_06775 [Rhodospirillales bacterium]|nr:hypothetical protein [Alphaproteobacteria bacterium]MBL6948364.1 hypothetical protein [Rhodospirillales bacterium]